jgi:quinol monooxygenase YgiN
MMTVIARYRTRPHRGDEVAHILVGHVSATRAEPGCLAFIVNRATDEPDEFILFEQYADEAAFEAHRRSAHFASNIERQVAPLLVEREWRRYEPVGPPAP